MMPSKVGADDYIVQTGATAADLDDLPRKRLAPAGRDLTEDALALEFSARHAEDLAYVHEWRQWLRWDGARWAEERTLDGVQSVPGALPGSERPDNEAGRSRRRSRAPRPSPRSSLSPEPTGATPAWRRTSTEILGS